MKYKSYVDTDIASLNEVLASLENGDVEGSKELLEDWVHQLENLLKSMKDSRGSKLKELIQFCIKHELTIDTSDEYGFYASCKHNNSVPLDQIKEYASAVSIINGKLSIRIKYPNND